MNIHDDNPMLENSFSADEPVQYVFDLDDTLISTAEHYIAAKDDWVRYTQETMVPFWDADGLLTVYDAIDTERQKRHHYSKDRVGGSLAIAYRDIAAHAERVYADHLEDDELEAFAQKHVPDDLQDRFYEIYEEQDAVFDEERVDRGAVESFKLGWDVVDKAPETYAMEGFIVTAEEGPVQGADQTLAYLADRDDAELHLLTAGVEKVQWPKVEGLQLYRFIPEDNMYVVQYDKMEKLEELAEKYGEDRVVMVGNSLNSDMAPAQEAGVGRVYFHYHDWEHDRFEDGVDTDHPRFMDIQRIEDMTAIHRMLTGHSEV